MYENEPSSEATCPDCGAVLTADTQVCPNCSGEEESSAPPPGSPAPDQEGEAGADWVDPTEEPVVEGPSQRLALGVIVGAVGAFGAMMAWYGLIITTGWEIGYAAWGVGVVVGIACLIGARRGDMVLGITAGGFALVAIIGGQYLAFETTAKQAIREEVDAYYNSTLELAKRAVGARTDGELRGVIAEIGDEEGNERKILEISDEEVADFREQSLPRYVDLINGNPSKEELIRMAEADFLGAMDPVERVKKSLSGWTILWLFLGVGSAFKIAYGGTQEVDEARERLRKRRQARGRPA